MFPSHSQTSNYVSTPSPRPLSSGERNSPGTTLLAEDQTVQDHERHNHPRTLTTVSGGPPARSPHHGPFGPNSRLMFQGGTNYFSIQQIYNEGADMPNILSGQGLFGSGSQVLLSGGKTTFQQEAHMHYHDHDTSTLLYQKSAPAAAYNSKERFDPPKCHKNTRTGLLNMVHDWANHYDAANDVVSLQPDTPQLLWLYGSAGAGKSAIAQTTSEDLMQLCILAASFFFSRTAPASSYRGDESRFVTTIAHQLTEVMPGLRAYVEKAIRNRPSVFDLTLSEQVMVLIMEPLKEVKRDKGDMNIASVYARIIVVDGLDECKEEAGQKQVLEAIATLIGHPEIFPFSVFLASRPELVIRTWIASKQSAHPNLIRCVSLLDHCDSDHDIEVFVKAEVVEIREVHPLRFEIPADWPSPKPIEEIVKRASGQFVYASTVMKYIKDLRNDPRQRLESILQNTIMRFDRPYAELDALYLHILRQTQHPTLVHRILAFRLVTVSFWADLDELDWPSHLQTFLSLPCCVKMLLVDLQSIMTCDIDEMAFMDDASIPYTDDDTTFLGVPIHYIFHHASFVEFLLDRQRSEEFHVDMDKFDEEFFQKALNEIGGHESEDYVVYCFLIALQTKTSRRPVSRDSLSDHLSMWDTLNSTMLGEILTRCSHERNASKHEPLHEAIDWDLLRHFSPLMERRQAQFQQVLEQANLPSELFPLIHVLEGSSCLDLNQFYSRVGLSGDATPGQLLTWYIIYLTPRFTRAFMLDDGDGGRLRPSLLSVRECRRPDWVDFVSEFASGFSQRQMEVPAIFSWMSDFVMHCSNAVVFIIEQIISLLDPSQDTTKPQGILAIFDSLKRQLGEHWRVATAAILLEEPMRFMYFHCPLSARLVSSLENISRCLFPLQSVSALEEIDFPFGFSHPERNRQLLTPSKAACALPRWLLTPCNFGGSSFTRLYNLGYAHDYVRLYNIVTQEIGRRDGSERTGDGMNIPNKGWADNVDITTMPAHKYPAYIFVRTADPETGRSINRFNWSLGDELKWITTRIDNRRREAGSSTKQNFVLHLGTPRIL